MAAEKSQQEVWAELSEERVSGNPPVEKPEELNQSDADALAEKPKPIEAKADGATDGEAGKGAAASAPAASAPSAPAPAPKPELTTEEKLADALTRMTKMEQRLRNTDGNIGGLKKAQADLNDAIQVAATKAAAGVEKAPSATQIAKAVANPEEWESLKATFPDWSNATEKFIDAKIATLNQGADVTQVDALVEAKLKTFEGTITAKLKSQVNSAALNGVFPDWELERPEIIEWAKSQSDEIKAWADSDEVGDAAKLLSSYYKGKDNNPVEKLSKKREAVLANSVAAPRGAKPPLVKTPDQMTPAELWAYEARQRERKKRLQSA